MFVETLRVGYICKNSEPEGLPVNTNTPQDVEAERLRLELRLQLLDAQEKATTSFLDFCKYVWPEMLVGEHHKIIAEAFDRVIAGKCKRLMIAMPPRHGKSQLGSYLFPAYVWAKSLTANSSLAPTPPNWPSALAG